MQKQVDILVPAYGPWPVSRYELELINEQASRDRDLVVVHCDGSLNFCPVRDIDKNVSCTDCIKTRSKLTKIMRKLTDYNEVTEFKVSQKMELENNNDTIFPDHDDRLIYSRSTIMTTFKSISAEKEHPTIYDSIVKDYNDGFNISKHFLKNYNVRNFYIFNARISFFRPFLYLAKRYSVDAFVYEVPMIGEENYIVTKNYALHDKVTWSFGLSNFSKQLYQNSTKEKKRELKTFAREWFENRSNFIEAKQLGAFDNKPYLKADVSGLLPEICYFNDNLRLLTYYVSSDFEHIGLPEIAQAFDIDQFGLVSELAKWAEQGQFRLIIRLHPNMSDSPKGELLKYKKFSESCDLICVVMPEEKIDSYALAKISDFVVTSGSTIGLEASYLGSNSIVCGASHYCAFNVAKHVSKLKELSEILKINSSPQANPSIVKSRCIDMIVALRYFSRQVQITRSIRGLMLYQKHWKFGFIMPLPIILKKILRRLLNYVR